MDVSHGQIAFAASGSRDHKQIFSHTPPHHIGRLDTLFLLPVWAAASLVLIGLTLAYRPVSSWMKKTFGKRKTYAPFFEDEEDDGQAAPTATYMPSKGLFNDFKAHVDDIGRYIFGFELARLACLMALLGLSIYATIYAEAPTLPKNQVGPAGIDNGSLDILKKKHSKHRKNKHRNNSTLNDLSTQEWAEFSVSVFYMYCAILSFSLLCLKTKSRLRSAIFVHSHFLLIAAWILYVYRDLYPLATFNLISVDTLHVAPWVTWSRVAILSFAAIVLPLFRPRHYRPVDPSEPQTEAHPEQVASIISLLTFQFVNPLIRKAQKMDSLPYDDLPPMTDYDRARYLSEKHMSKLDPIRRKQKGLPPRHLFVGLAHTFWKEYLVMAFLMVVKCVMDFASPIGINQLLNYLQSNGEHAQIRPIVWVLWLFLGPVLGSMAFHTYIFITTRCLVRTEAIFSQLIFDHSLRVRMQDDERQEDVPILGTATPVIIVEDTNGVAHGHTIIEAENAGDAAIHPVQSNVTQDDGSSTNSNVNPAETHATAKSGSMLGRINTLISTDIDNIIEASWSSLIGMLILVLTLPIPGLLARLLNTVQGQLMAATDARVGEITEAMGAVRMLKMFGWEVKSKERIDEKREKELKISRKKQIISQLVDTSNYILPVVTTVVTFMLYTVVQKRALTAGKVFSSIAVFDLIREQLHQVTWFVTCVIQGKVSIERVDDFLNKTELLEYLEKPKLPYQPTEIDTNQEIVVHHGLFKWQRPESTSERQFQLKIDDLRFPRGKISVIAGPTGCGKTSLLLGLLGEMIFEPLEQDGYFVLPRSGGIALATQDPWVSAGSIRSNIVFGSPFDLDRYNAVLKACAFETDIKLMPDGDMTEVGEAGRTLSGGQKARLSLARCVYSSQDIILMDDVLSALDTHTSKHIVDTLFNGDLVKDRTVVLVTHHIQLLREVASFIVHLSSDGTIASQGDLESALLHDPELKHELEEDERELEKEDPSEKEEDEELADKDTKPVTKLVVDEEKAVGRIQFKTLSIFLQALGGVIFWVLWPLGCLLGELVIASSPLVLGRWASAYNTAKDPRDVSVGYWLGLYTLLVGGQCILWNITNVSFIFAGIKASRTMHERLVKYIFGTNLRFYDATPVGRIVSRFTKDIKTIDGSFQRLFVALVELSISLLLRFCYLLYFVPKFSIVAIVLGFIGAMLGNAYIHCQICVKREMSNAKSPVFSQLNSAIAGVISIRAYGVQTAFRTDTQGKLDKYTRTATTFYNLNRWVSFRIDVLGGLLASGLAAYLVYAHHNMDPAIVGFSLTIAVSVSQIILYWVRISNEFEVSANSIERLQDYCTIDQEPAHVREKEPPAAWPTSGEVVLEHLSARYSEDGPTVLDDISLSVPSGSRIGIVGRTGSGKSTTALALLRLIPTTGSVIIDGIDTKDINLDDLRSRLALVMQDPTLLSGSLRFNLDPYDMYEDHELNAAMSASGLSATRQSKDGVSTPMALTLDTAIASGGSNLSQGQRQLVALARALVRQAKILIMDEATASVDFETDTLVQQAIKKLEGVTILTIAHRLDTIIEYDKILVLDAGKKMEYDSPSNLLKNPDSFFRRLVENSGHKELLFSLAENNQSR
ncbi:hypothetical protein QFC22_000471 [Naganishia vaughanmartiniae]|uniref:Uncharacterized protein n=1 Tax=Naganishia vaughanmartiniae TaxID=1424756 RepID=A0ACC2XPG5_9TREE|nr:hypothetical protein QFC22_000471 [Naganishia vaughanmartiniae]